jgi:hypothetical protein
VVAGKDGKSSKLIYQAQAGWTRVFSAHRRLPSGICLDDGSVASADRDLADVAGRDLGWDA